MNDIQLWNTLVWHVLIRDHGFTCHPHTGYKELKFNIRPMPTITCCLLVSYVAYTPLWSVTDNDRQQITTDDDNYEKNNTAPPPYDII